MCFLRERGGGRGRRGREGRRERGERERGFHLTTLSANKITASVVTE